MTPRLSDLREPPVAGQFYLVPVVDFVWDGNKGAWPVAGPLHNDTDFFNFDQLHYHLDPRFFTRQQARVATNAGRSRQLWSATAELHRHDPIAISVGAMPLSHRVRPLPKGMPRLVRRKCRASEWPAYAFSGRDPIKAVNAHFPNATPIRRADGRLLCPHRKFDLSSLAPDANGFVTCPLHGLRVNCAAQAIETRSDTTENTGVARKGESAVGNADAPNLPLRNPPGSDGEIDV